MPNIKCMLAAKAPELSKLVYPVYVSHKLDGVRCLVIDGVAYSRNMKPIPSVQVQSAASSGVFDGMDGELIAGPPTAPNAYRRTVSATMAQLNEDPEMHFHVFDMWDSVGLSFTERWRTLRSRASATRGRKLPAFFTLVNHVRVHTAVEIERMEAEALAAGHEGLMINAPSATYRNGRSTAREGALLKLKRFDDGEAVVIGVVELQHNENELGRDELGRAHRTTHAANKRGGGVLGALVVRDVRSGIEFSVGTGFDAAQRAGMWARRKSLLGEVIKYKFFPTGSKERPRFPTYCGLRSSIDM